MEWLKETYSLRDVQSRLHTGGTGLVVKVVGGVYGQGEFDTLEDGQVLWISDCLTQTRVIAKDRLGRHFTLPLNCSLRYRLGHQDLSTSLEEITKLTSFPVKVQCILEDNQHCFTNPGRYPFGETELLHIYKKDYFKAHFIKQGSIDIQSGFLLPSHVDTKFSIASNLGEEFEENMSKQLEGIDMSNIKGDNDIRIYPADIPVASLITSGSTSFARRLSIHDSPSNRPEMKGTEQEEDSSNIYKFIYDSSGDPGMIKPQLPPRPDALMKEMLARQTSMGSGATAGSATGITKLSPATKLLRAKSVPQTTKVEKSPDMLSAKKKLEAKLVSEERAVPNLYTLSSEDVGSGPQLLNIPAPDCENIAAVHGNTPTTSAFESLSSIPQDVSSLTVDQIGKCLVLLNMQQHKEQFADLQIDGELLKVLDEGDLMKEFNMSKIAAKKIIMFARNGWRPKGVTPSNDVAFV